ncbi:Protein hedgehog [Seminavis robusta]|uniref:Protein hedgehog n=1 Tax=Seminavis robusta TaxID=568900 RepID=A0A9N8DUY5_9STRA|nr:Protein hedgehog [Seminavis robusta]|eukprot:Sro370_g128490.1 Protein hedgehog (706) ;mRNA; r:44318-46674
MVSFVPPLHLFMVAIYWTLLLPILVHGEALERSHSQDEYFCDLLSSSDDHRRLLERNLKLGRLLQDEGDDQIARYYSSSEDDEEEEGFEEITDGNMQIAVEEWITNRTGAMIRFGPINQWDVSRVTHMYNLFKDKGTFNDNIGNWNVQCVTTMHGMFWGANQFDQDISRWKPVSVTNMYSMFREAFRFNQDLPWPARSNAEMSNMFFLATRMQGDLSDLDTSNVYSMDGAFMYSNYNQDISSWDVSNVVNMQQMFEGNTQFNQSLPWETTSLQLFDRMFFNATSFEQRLCWDIEETDIPQFQVFCDTAGGKFNQWCVGEEVLYNANRRCVSGIDSYLQSWIDFFNDIGDFFTDLLDFINECLTDIGEFFAGIGEIFVCFAPEARTPVEHRGLVAMKDLQVGDKVLTASGQYQPVYSMFHYDKTKPTTYIQIHTTFSQNNSTGVRPLELTPSHMLHVVGHDNPIPASQVRLGDYLFVMDSENGSCSSQDLSAACKHWQKTEVVEIKEVIRNGLYNPLTQDGTIVVDGIVTSAYTSFLGTEYIQLFRRVSTASVASTTTTPAAMTDDDGWKAMSHQSFVHMMLSPYRTVCLYVSPNLCKPSGDGQSESKWYGRLGHAILFLWLRQNVLFQAVIFFALVAIFGLINLVLNPFGIAVSLILYGTSVLFRQRDLQEHHSAPRKPVKAIHVQRQEQKDWTYILETHSFGNR